MKRDEKICGTLFLLAMIGAFARPLFAKALPSLEPAYIFAILGALSFVITSADKKNPILTWEHAQKNTTMIARSLVRCISVITFAIPAPAPEPFTILPSARPPPNRSIMPHSIFF